jgi:hypothetical protein
MHIPESRIGRGQRLHADTHTHTHTNTNTYYMYIPESLLARRERLSHYTDALTSPRSPHSKTHTIVLVKKT